MLDGRPAARAPAASIEEKACRWCG